MLRKISVGIILLFSFVLAACGGDDDGINRDVDYENLIEFTLDTLAENDGIDGRPAYIAVDGYVYDVSDSAHWMNGLHQQGIRAGADLTHEIDTISPHGRSVLNNVPLIGVLIDNEEVVD